MFGSELIHFICLEILYWATSLDRSAALGISINYISKSTHLKTPYLQTYGTYKIKTINFLKTSLLIVCIKVDKYMKTKTEYPLNQY